MPISTETYLILVKFIFIAQLAILIPMLIYAARNRMDPTIKKKLKYICALKGVKMEKLLDMILEHYTDEIAQRNNIDWDKILN